MSPVMSDVTGGGGDVITSRVCKRLRGRESTGSGNTHCSGSVEGSPSINVKLSAAANAAEFYAKYCTVEKLRKTEIMRRQLMMDRCSTSYLLATISARDCYQSKHRRGIGS
jgi:hypothetical protein